MHRNWVTEDPRRLHGSAFDVKMNISEAWTGSNTTAISTVTVTSTHHRGQHTHTHTTTPRRSLRSAGRGDLFVSRANTSIGQRSFSIAAPVVWNALPLDLRSPHISRKQFRSKLKTYLFRQVYTAWFLWERCWSVTCNCNCNCNARHTAKPIYGSRKARA